MLSAPQALGYSFNYAPFPAAAAAWGDFSPSQLCCDLSNVAKQSHG